MGKVWGYHLLVDCASCNKQAIKDERIHRMFLRELVKRIAMIAYKDPIMAHFATHDPEKGGWTIAQMIETSLIDGHFVDSNGDAYISVHSCKTFDPQTVLATIQEFYNPIRMTSRVIDRAAPDV